MRHVWEEAPVQMQRAARDLQHFVTAAKIFRCQGCDNTKPRAQTHEVSPPRPSTFNHEVGVDVFEIFDYALLDIECCLYGEPHACLRAFVHGWTRWAGWPRLVRYDRGIHSRGGFSSTLAKNCVVIKPA